VAEKWDGEIATLSVYVGMGAESFRLDKADVLVGSDPACDVVVPESAGMRCRIVRRNGGYALLNLTRLPIELNYERTPRLTPLASHDRIGIDDFTMGIEWDYPPGSLWPSVKTSQGMLDSASSGFEVDPTSPRKHRLLMAACSRHFGLVSEGAPRMRFVEALEQLAEGKKIRGVLPPSWYRDDDSWRDATNFAREAVCYAIESRGDIEADERPEAELWPLYDEAEAEVCRLIREVYGNPFVPCLVTDAVRRWESGTVERLAKSAYDERLPDGTLDLARLAVLADALQDAGCGEGSLVDHLRAPGPHYRGCWAVDAVLGWS